MPALVKSVLSHSGVPTPGESASAAGDEEMAGYGKDDMADLTSAEKKVLKNAQASALILMVRKYPDTLERLSKLSSGEAA